MLIMTWQDFDNFRGGNLAEPETAYKLRNIDGSFSFAYTDDGIGFFFYKTLAELHAEHQKDRGLHSALSRASPVNWYERIAKGATEGNKRPHGTSASVAKSSTPKQVSKRLPQPTNPKESN